VDHVRVSIDRVSQPATHSGGDYPISSLGNVTAKRRAAATVAIIIGMGCASIPIAVLIGFLEHATPT